MSLSVGPRIVRSTVSPCAGPIGRTRNAMVKKVAWFIRTLPYAICRNRKCHRGNTPKSRRVRGVKCSTYTQWPRPVNSGTSVATNQERLDDQPVRRNRQEFDELFAERQIAEQLDGLGEAPARVGIRADFLLDA